MSKTENTDRYLVPGLLKGLDVLAAFTPERQEMGLSEIARVIGLSRSATFRAVYTLTKAGCLFQDAHTKAYSLGPGVLKLGYGYMASRELIETALPELERLRDRTGWSTHLGVRDGNSVVYMLRAPSGDHEGSIIHVGSRLPAATTTMGRVLLAGLDEDTLIALYRDDARDQGELLRQWRKDRQGTIVQQAGRFQAGIGSVAAPVTNRAGNVIAAINASAPLKAGDAIPPDVLKAVPESGDEISRMYRSLDGDR